MPRSTKVVVRKLGRERAAGEAYYGCNEIAIDPRQTPSDYLDTLIHEGTHLAFPELTEEAVCAAATFISRIVWKHGYRKCDL
jgi:hypothetical protein